jgi:exodeoxyribonuclease III
VTLRLLTYNIRTGGRGRVDALAAVIGSATPDVVLLQEATDATVVRELAGRLGMADFQTFSRQSLAYMSRTPVETAKWVHPRLSRHAFVEVTLDRRVHVFGVHLSAVLSAWTERRRLFELRALLRSVEQHEPGFHVLAGDFNTVTPGDTFDRQRLPLRLQALVWMSAGRIKWRTTEQVQDAGYVDAYRLKHPHEPGLTLPTSNPQVRLDYVFVPDRYAGRVTACDVVRHPEGIKASDHYPVMVDLQI